MEVLPALRPAALPIHAIYRAGTKLAPRTRAFLDFIVALPARRPKRRC